LLSELEASGVETRSVIGDIVDRAELDDGVQIEVQA